MEGLAECITRGLQSITPLADGFELELNAEIKSRLTSNDLFKLDWSLLDDTIEVDDSILTADVICRLVFINRNTLQLRFELSHEKTENEWIKKLSISDCIQRNALFENKKDFIKKSTDVPSKEKPLESAIDAKVERKISLKEFLAETRDAPINESWTSE